MPLGGLNVTLYSASITPRIGVYERMFPCAALDAPKLHVLCTSLRHADRRARSEPEGVRESGLHGPAGPCGTRWGPARVTRWVGEIAVALWRAARCLAGVPTTHGPARDEQAATKEHRGSGLGHRIPGTHRNDGCGYVELETPGHGRFPDLRHTLSAGELIRSHRVEQAIGGDYRNFPDDLANRDCVEISVKNS